MASTRRDLIYRMTADPDGFKKGMREAGQDSKQFWKELKDLEKQQKAVDDVMTGTGTALLAFGAAATLGLGLAAKSAIEWESAWAGVSKTVEGSPEQLAALEEELRGLATTLPQTHAEIAGVAAAAGQLGVATEDISGFTKVMVDLGVATNLTSEEAAFALARMMNIMQTAPGDVERLGSTIVDLGNNSATTEADIVAMALRISGVGKTVGLSEAEVLSFSAALSSVGVEAEGGGSAISTAMIKISEAVAGGGESLDEFASVAGVSADEFADQFSTDPAAAIDLFVQGLGRIQAEGGNVFATMESLGLSEIQLRDALLRLAGAGDLLTRSLATGNTAWDENSALMKEASARYGTTEAQIQIARNQLVDLGISLGEALLPAINTFLDTASGFASFFAGLPGPVKTLIVALGVGAAAIALIGGAALIAVPKFHALTTALGDMGTKRAGMAQKALGGLASFMTGPFGIAIGAAVVAIGLFVGKQAEARARVEELAGTLDEQTSAVTGNTRAWIANELEQSGALETAQKMGIDLTTLVSAIEGVPSAVHEVNTSLDEHKTKLEGTTTATTSLTGDLTMLRGEEKQLANDIKTVTGDLDTAKESHERKAEAAAQDAEATAGASVATQTFSNELGIATVAAEDATAGFDALDQQVRALIDSTFALSGAERDVEAAIDDVTEKLEKNGATFDSTTEAGRDNEIAVEDLTGAIADLAVTTARETGSAKDANAVLATQRDRLRDVLTQAGFTEDEISDYIDTLDRVPDLIDTTVDANINIHVNTTETLNRRIVEEFGKDAPLINEKGGVYYPAQDGLLRDAGVFSTVSPARYAFAEPQTGGEAFVPRLGDRSRSLGILSEAAAWHRATVVPHEAGGSGGQTINVNLQAYSDQFSLKQTLDDLAMRGAS